jgi:hypothetical protein
VKKFGSKRCWCRNTGSAAASKARSPAIGDIGLVVDVDASGGRMIYTVESVGTDVSERWLTEFVEDELEPIPPGSYAAST